MITIITRILLTITLIYFTYLETGYVTALCFTLLFIYVELTAFFKKKR